MITPKEQYRRAWQAARLNYRIIKYTHAESWSYDARLIDHNLNRTKAVYPYTFIAFQHLKERNGE